MEFMEINIGMSECDKNVDNHNGSHITVWIPRCAGREAFDSVEPLHGYYKIALKKCEKAKMKNKDKRFV